MKPTREKQDVISSRRSNAPIMLRRLVRHIKDFPYIIIYT